jgi:integrase
VKIKFRQKVSSLISLCGLHRLIWDNTLRTCIKPLSRRAIPYYECTQCFKPVFYAPCGCRVSEARRQQLKDLEARMATLHKQLADQKKLLKLKQKEKDALKMNTEIQVQFMAWGGSLVWLDSVA